MSTMTLLGNVDDQGRLHTYPGAPVANSSLRGGIAMLPLGSTCVTSVVDSNFVNGFMVAADGSLVVINGGVIASYHMGFPRDASGRLVGQLDVIPAAADPYVCGIRIGPSGGVYGTSALPT